ncbi:MAG: putative PEP-binding protein [Candidatus Omnitrophota bacterium]|nr:putative PEP-binding protein [Candidatus Omnitrophota bacterium]
MSLFVNGAFVIGTLSGIVLMFMVLGYSVVYLIGALPMPAVSTFWSTFFLILQYAFGSFTASLILPQLLSYIMAFPFIILEWIIDQLIWIQKALSPDKKAGTLRAEFGEISKLFTRQSPRAPIEEVPHEVMTMLIAKPVKKISPVDFIGRYSGVYYDHGAGKFAKGIITPEDAAVKELYDLLIESNKLVRWTLIERIVRAARSLLGKFIPGLRAPPVYIEVVEDLGTNAVKYIDENTGLVHIVFDRNFVDTLLKYKSSKYAQVAAHLMAERLSHELRHSNKILSSEDRKAEEKRIVRRDLLSFEDMMKDQALYELIYEFFKEEKPSFPSGRYFRDFLLGVLCFAKNRKARLSAIGGLVEKFYGGEDVQAGVHALPIIPGLSGTRQSAETDSIYEKLERASGAEEVRSILLDRIKDDNDLVDAFDKDLPVEVSDVKPVSVEFAKVCLNEMFTEDHTFRHRLKLYGEIFDLWQVFRQAAEAKKIGKTDYFMTINDAKRTVKDGTCTQIFFAAPDRTGSEENITTEIKDINIFRRWECHSAYEGIALSLYQLQESDSSKEAVSPEKLRDLMGRYTADTENKFTLYNSEDDIAKLDSLLKTCAVKLAGIHECESNGIPGGIWDGIVFDYTAVEAGEAQPNDLNPGYKITKENLNQERTHVESVFKPYIHDANKRMKDMPAGAREQLALNITIATDNMIRQIKIEKDRSDAASQLKESFGRWASAIKVIYKGREKDGEVVRNLMARFINALDGGYTVTPEEISLEKEELLASFSRVSERGPLSDSALVDKILYGAMSKIESDHYTARFALWQWLNENYPQDKIDSVRTGEADKAETIINEICTTLSLEEVVIKGMAELSQYAKESGREIIVASKDSISDEVVLRAFTDKYNVKAFVFCRGSTTDHASITATACGAFLLIGLPEIVFDRLVKTDVSASLVTSDEGSESNFYIGPSNTENGMKMAHDYMSAIVLRQYYRAKEDSRQESGKFIAETIDGNPADRARIPVYGNINLPLHLRRGDSGIEEDGALDILEKIYTNGANGIALVRTEYIFKGEVPPDFAAQKELYIAMARYTKEFDGNSRALTFRTFDKESDKACLSLPNPENKYGFDYYRTGRGRQELKIQLKALLAASAECDNIQVDFPMVNNMNDIVFLHSVLEEAKTELLAEDRRISRATLDKMPLGIMAEDRELFMNSDGSANTNFEEILDNTLMKISFVSIGPNDLISSVKRVKRSLIKSEHYDKEILALIERVVRETAKRKGSVTMCGDFARFSKTLMFSIYLYNKYGIPLIPGIVYDMIPKSKTLIESCNAKNCSEMLKGWELKTDKDINGIIKTKTATIINRLRAEPEFEPLMNKGMREFLAPEPRTAMSMAANLFKSEKAFGPLVLIGVPSGMTDRAQVIDAIKDNLGGRAEVVIVDDRHDLAARELSAAARQKHLTAVLIDKSLTLETVKTKNFSDDVYSIKLAKEYDVILTMNNVSDKTRRQIAETIKALLGSLSAVDFDRAVREFKAVPMTADKSAKIEKIRGLVAKRRGEIASIYNNEPILTKAQLKDKPITIATTERVAMSDIYFGENMTLANKERIKNVFIYGDELKDESDARKFVLASGYLGDMSEIKFIHKTNAINELAGSENVGIRTTEGELGSTEEITRVKGKLLEIQAIDMNNQKVYVAMNSYQALLKMMISPEGELPPGVSYDEIRHIFRFLPRTVPIDYDKEVRSYIEAIAVIRTAA